MCLQNAVNVGMKSFVKCSRHGASLGNIAAPNSVESGRKERKERQPINNA